MQPRPALVMLATTIVFLSGCFGSSDAPPLDDGGPAQLLAPEPDPLPSFDGLEWVASGDRNHTAGIFVFEDRLYASGTSGLRIYDVSDPANITLIGGPVEGTQVSEDVEVWRHEDGRTYAVVSQGRSAGDYAQVEGLPSATLVDVTLPLEAEVVSRATEIGEAHNIAVVPNHSIVYVSHSTNDAGLGQWTPGSAATGKIDIVDFSDPLNPTVSLYEFPIAPLAQETPTPIVAPSCHDVTFNGELERAYCSAITQTLIWDVSDPKDPQELASITLPLNTIHHGAWDDHGGDLLILGDEHISIFAGQGPFCAEDEDLPTAGLWFYDISDLALPEPVGYFTVRWDPIADGGGGVPYCSVHFGEPLRGHDIFVTGWYAAGTVVLDYSDPANPVQLAHWVVPGAGAEAGATFTNTWETKYVNGHLVTGDMARGIDVLRVL